MSLGWVGSLLLKIQSDVKYLKIEQAQSEDDQSIAVQYWSIQHDE